MKEEQDQTIANYGTFTFFPRKKNNQNQKETDNNRNNKPNYGTFEEATHSFSPNYNDEVNLDDYYLDNKNKLEPECYHTSRKKEFR